MYRFKRAVRPHRRLFLESLEQRQLCVASLSIETAINGLDASSPPGPNFVPGTSIELTYQVTNTGDEPLTDVQVIDDRGTRPIADDFYPTPLLTTSIARGSLANTFTGLNALKFLEHPTLPYVYASIMSTHSIAVINTQTLAIESNIPLGMGSGPLGMALSNNGTRLYVGMVFANKIAVIDTTTNAELPSINVGAPVGDVEVGIDGRLFALTPDSIRQISPETGQAVGPNLNNQTINGMTVNQGVLDISPDKTFLYYGDQGLSPSSVYKINVSNPALPTRAWESPHGPASTGRDLEFTRDGNFFSYVSVMGPTNEYAIAKQRTSDMGIVGRFVTGPFPEEIVYSPNGAFAYTSIGPPNASNSKAVVWDANSFTQAGEIAMPGLPHEMFIPRSGRYLFASVDSADPVTDSLYVYETGRTGGLNVGDLNENGKLDPGESWSYSYTTTAQIGQFAYLGGALAVSDNAQMISAMTTTYFESFPGTSDIAASAIENVAGQIIGDMPPNPWNGNWATSDNRFEVVDGELRLKPDQHLTAEADDGIVVGVRTQEATPRLIARFTIDVQPNPRPWHKPDEPRDVDGNNHIIPLDALIIINYLHIVGPGPLDARPAMQSHFIDVNADGYLTAADALAIINWLHANPVSFDGEGESEGEWPLAAAQAPSLLPLTDDDQRQPATVDSIVEVPPPQSSTPVATDWVFALLETEESTARGRRTAGMSSDAAPWWSDAGSEEAGNELP